MARFVTQFGWAALVLFLFSCSVTAVQQTSGASDKEEALKKAMSLIEGRSALSN